MKNILNSKIIVSGARHHWTGDHNGRTVTPKIEISGLNEGGDPYGRVFANIRRSTTDGGASTTLWSLDIPFGKTGFPTLEEIDEKWEKMVDMGVSYLFFRGDVLVIELRDGTYVPFAEI